MATPKTTKPKKKKPSGTPRRRRGVKLRPTDLGPRDLAVTTPSAAVATLAEAVERDGGKVLSIYREPLGGHELVFAALPIELVAPTPFQRDISDAHVRRLTVAMDKTRRFLDPVIAVREERASAADDEADGASAKRYWIPNGYHRLTALRELGAKSLLALIVPEPAVAYQILALNIEKPHNLREKALGTVRMLQDLLAVSNAQTLKTVREEDFALEFEEPALLTLGYAYQERPRLSGGAYHPILHRADAWIGGALAAAAEARVARSHALLALDEAVGAVVDKLKERGFKSPYLRPFVVARINPLRFMKGSAPPVDELIASMTKRARGMNADKIRPEDVARTGGAPEAAAE